MNELKYRVNEGVLTINEKEIKLPYPVIEVLNFQGLIIVRVEPSIGEIYNQNIFAIDNTGKIMWQIVESPHGTEADKLYTSISVLAENQLIAGNWNGVDYAVDLDDGSISTKSFNK